MYKTKLFASALAITAALALSPAQAEMVATTANTNTSTAAIPSAKAEENKADAAAQIKTALDQYNAGQLSDSIQSLEAAKEAIMQVRSQGFLKLFPDSFEKMAIDTSKSDDVVAGSAAFGGGITMKRTYRHAENTNAAVEVSLIADSPLINSLMGLMKMATSVSSSGNKTLEIQGHKALVRNKPGKPLKLMVIVDNIMVDFQAAEGAAPVTVEQLTYVANHMNYDALK